MVKNLNNGILRWRLQTTLLNEVFGVWINIITVQLTPVTKHIDHEWYGGLN